MMHGWLSGETLALTSAVLGAPLDSFALPLCMFQIIHLQTNTRNHQPKIDGEAAIAMALLGAIAAVAGPPLAVGAVVQAFQHGSALRALADSGVPLGWESPPMALAILWAACWAASCVAYALSFWLATRAPSGSAPGR